MEFNPLPSILKVEDHFKKQNINLFLYVIMHGDYYFLFVHNIEMGFCHQLCKYKDWDTMKGQTQFYSDFLNLPFQYALD